MATLIAVVVFLGGIAAMAFSQLLVEELKAWVPWITHFLIRMAVRRLPHEQRERFTEEWAAHVNDMPGKIGEALRLLLAAHRMRPMLEEGPSPVEEHLGDIIVKEENGQRWILIQAKVPAFSMIKVDLKNLRIVRVPLNPEDVGT